MSVICVGPLSLNLDIHIGREDEHKFILATRTKFSKVVTQTLCCVYLQDFFDKYFPTREVFAALSAFVLQLAPKFEQEVQAYKTRRFKVYTIGIQIRRRKCNGNRKDLHCEYRPSIESYCQVGIQ